MRVSQGAYQVLDQHCEVRHTQFGFPSYSQTCPCDLGQLTRPLQICSFIQKGEHKTPFPDFLGSMAEKTPTKRLV